MLGDTTGSRRFVCVSIPKDQNIDYTDNVNHEQLFAQALHLFNNKERFWLDDDEIKELIAENEPYQKTIDLVEMISESFSRPKADEGRWWKSSEIYNHLASKYTYFDAKKTAPTVLGRAMNNYKFGFKHRNVNGLTEYWLQEK